MATILKKPKKSPVKKIKPPRSEARIAKTTAELLKKKGVRKTKLQKKSKATPPKKKPRK